MVLSAAARGAKASDCFSRATKAVGITVWPSLPSPDPWLAPQIRRVLGLPGLEYRTGLAAHDFMSALGAPRVLLTRARRDSRSPTIASRLWLRLQAMTGGMTRDQRLERMAAALDASNTGHHQVNERLAQIEQRLASIERTLTDIP